MTKIVLPANKEKDAGNCASSEYMHFTWQASYCNSKCHKFKVMLLQQQSSWFKNKLLFV